MGKNKKFRRGSHRLKKIRECLLQLFILLLVLGGYSVLMFVLWDKISASEHLILGVTLLLSYFGFFHLCYSFAVIYRDCFDEGVKYDSIMRFRKLRDKIHLVTLLVLSCLVIPFTFGLLSL